MKAAGTLVCVAAVLGVISISQNVVDGGKSELKRRLLAEWSDANKNIMNNDGMSLKKLDINDCPELKRRNDNLNGLPEVMQCVITDSLNNREFRSFVIKRFLHNFVPQASNYMKKTRSLKKKMNPYGANEDAAGLNIAIH